jgi:hypothetical protein
MSWLKNKPKTQKPKIKIEIQIPGEWDQAAVNGYLQNLVEACNPKEIKLLSESAQNPMIKKMAINALKTFN